MTRIRLGRRLRQGARHVTISGLAGAQYATGRSTKLLQRPRVHNMYLHAVPASEEGSFRSFLDWLKGTGHAFLSYSEGVSMVRSGAIDQPYVTFSFDDGFASNLRAARILREYDTTGCFFVVSGFIGRTDLADARAFLGRGIAEPAMSWADLESLKNEGHEIGNHTRRHRRLSSLARDELEDEIGGSATLLRSRLGCVEHFAWPFGRFFHFNAEARDLVFATGHTTCASAERGAHPAGLPFEDLSKLCLRREHIMSEWPLRHSRYFWTRSALQMKRDEARWPALWDVAQA